MEEIDIAVSSNTTESVFRTVNAIYADAVGVYRANPQWFRKERHELEALILQVEDGDADTEGPEFSFSAEYANQRELWRARRRIVGRHPDTCKWRLVDIVSGKGYQILTKQQDDLQEP